MMVGGHTDAEDNATITSILINTSFAAGTGYTYGEEYTFTSGGSVTGVGGGGGGGGVGGRGGGGVGGVVGGENVSDRNNATVALEADMDVVASAVVGTILTGVVLCTVTGNVMVLLAVFVNSHLRSTTNYFIVNLAIADLLLGTTVLPFSASLEVFKKWMFGQVFCDIWAAIDVLCCTASIFSLCVISIDRYIGVTRPLQRSAIMTESRAVYVIIFIWLLAMAISIAPLIGWKEPPSQDPYECTVTTQTGYVLFSVSASFYIPLLIILLVYFRIYREAIRHTKFLATGVKTTKVDESGVTLRVHKGGNSHVHYGQCSPKLAKTSSGGGGGGHAASTTTTINTNVTTTSTATSSSSTTTSKTPLHQSSSSSERSDGSASNKIPSRMTAAGKVARFKRETKAAKTLGIVVGVFLLCWFPFFFILPLSSLCSQCNIPPLLFNVFFWLGYCNSLMNPVIYACSSREFQFAFRRILRCQFRRRPRVFLTDQESSSCHEFNQINENTATNGNRHHHHHGYHSGSKSKRWGKKSKSRHDKFIRTFKSSMPTSSRHSHTNCGLSRPMVMQSFSTNSTCSADHHQLAVVESPSESLRALHCKIGAELRRNHTTSLTTNCDEGGGGGEDWSPTASGDGGVGGVVAGSVVRRESISAEDLFEDLTKGSLGYPTPCSTR